MLYGTFLFMPRFVEIPAGEYTVTPSEWWVERCKEVPEYNHFDESNTAQLITLEKPLYVATFPITNQEFEEFIPTHARSQYSQEDASPVTAVTYYEALRFCQEYGYRMPTRQEWLLAAVGNTGWTYSNSPEVDVTVINRFDQESDYHGTNLEGEYPPNPFGLHDMSGNIIEFHSPIHKLELGGIAVKLVMMSGGSWGTCKDGAVPFAHFAQDPFVRNDRVGFRVVKDV